MLAGKGSGPALLVVAVLVAAWMAQRASSQASVTR